MTVKMRAPVGVSNIQLADGTMLDASSGFVSADSSYVSQLLAMGCAGVPTAMYLTSPSGYVFAVTVSDGGVLAAAQVTSS